jgi:hypothetical protein
MKSTLIICLILCIQFAKANSSDTTKVGVFITSVYDLDYLKNSFTIEYWLWRLNKNPEFKEYYLFEATNSKEDKKLFSSADWKDQSENQIVKSTGDTIFWDYENFRSTIKHDFNIAKYPFDKEILTVKFEGVSYYDDWVKLVIDHENSGRNLLGINGWKIGEMKISRTNNVYSSNFGSPGDTSNHVYSGFTIQIPISRDGWALFFKLFSGLFVAFVIALFSLRINIAEADGRFGVCVGALFAALANMYIVNSNLPIVSQFSFMDKAHVLVIFLILVLFITSTFSLQYFKEERIERSKKLDKVVVLSVISTFTIGMIAIWPY